MEALELLEVLDSRLSTLAGLIADVQAKQEVLRIPPPTASAPPPPPPPPLSLPDTGGRGKDSYRLKQLREKMLDNEQLSTQETLLLAEAGELLKGADLYLAQLSSGRALAEHEITTLRKEGLYFDGELKTEDDDLPLEDAHAILERARQVPTLKTYHHYSGKQRYSGTLDSPVKKPKPTEILDMLQDVSEGMKRKVRKAVVMDARKNLVRVRDELLTKAREAELEEHHEHLKRVQQSTKEGVTSDLDALKKTFADCPGRICNLDMDQLVESLSEKLIDDQIAALKVSIQGADTSDLISYSTSDISSNKQEWKADAIETLGGAADELRDSLYLRLKTQRENMEALDIYRTATALRSSQDDAHLYRSLHPGEFEEYNVTGPGISSVKKDGKEDGETIIQARTHTMSDDERAQSTVRVEDGKLLRGDGTVHDTTEQTAQLSFSGESDGKDMWVQDQDGTIRTASQDDLTSGLHEHNEAMRRLREDGKANISDRDDVEKYGFAPIEVGHHTTLGEGEVRGAGELESVDGRVVTISNSSGHYKPGMDGLVEGVETLDRMGAMSRTATVENVKSRTEQESFHVSAVVASGGNLVRLRRLQAELKEAGRTVDPDRIRAGLESALAKDGHSPDEVAELLQGDVSSLQDRLSSEPLSDEDRSTITEKIALMKSLSEQLGWQVKRTVTGEDPVNGPAATRLKEAYRERLRALEERVATEQASLESRLSALASESEEWATLFTEKAELKKQLATIAAAREAQEAAEQALPELREQLAGLEPESEACAALKEKEAELEAQIAAEIEAEAPILGEVSRLDERLAELDAVRQEWIQTENALTLLMKKHPRKLKSLEQQLQKRLVKLGLTGAEVALILQLEGITQRRRELESLKGQKIVSGTRGETMESILRRRRESLEEQS